jgi:hypothetical protein
LISEPVGVQAWLEQGLTLIKANITHIHQLSNDNGTDLKDYLLLAQRIPNLTVQEHNTLREALCKPSTHHFKEEHVQAKRTTNTVPLMAAMVDPAQLAAPLQPHQCDYKKGDWVAFLPSLAYGDASAADDRQYSRDI